MKPLITRDRAKMCAVINTLGGPGFGTLMAGQTVVGALQLTLACGGVMVSFFAVLRVVSDVYESFNTGARDPVFPWFGWLGFGLFGVAWLWALMTSLSLLRATRPPPRL